MLIAGVLNLLVLLIILWLQAKRSVREQLTNQEQLQAMQQLQLMHTQGNERLERELRAEMQQGGLGVAATVNAARLETQQTLAANLAQMQGGVQQQLTGFQGNMTTQLQSITEGNARRLTEVRETLDAQLTRVREALNQQLEQLGAKNEAKLDEMRRTVDEKLQATLETRLGESFKQVADRLEQVHKGLGEMQTLAAGVGDLKSLLTNVKTKGNFGEIQLENLLEQVFTVDQYGKQVNVIPGRKSAVDFAIRLPGTGNDGAPFWLPIDSKFPTEAYDRLQMAQDRSDAAAAEMAGNDLEAKIRQEAKSIAEKYISPPHTTDFAILFLPAENLYAEVLRRPGLMVDLQRNMHVTLAGPTTLLAMLNALQMGFRTLALQQSSSEIRRVLSDVKTQFGKFGDFVSKVKSQAETVVRTLDEADTRTKALNKKLKDVEELPAIPLQPNELLQIDKLNDET